MESRRRNLSFLVVFLILMNSFAANLADGIGKTQNELATSEAPNSASQEEEVYEYEEYDDKEEETDGTTLTPEEKPFPIDPRPHISDPENKLDEERASLQTVERTPIQDDGLDDDPSNFLQSIGQPVSNDPPSNVEFPQNPPKNLSGEVKAGDEPIELQMPSEEVLKMDKRGSVVAEGNKSLDEKVEPGGVVIPAKPKPIRGSVVAKGNKTLDEKVKKVEEKKEKSKAGVVTPVKPKPIRLGTRLAILVRTHPLTITLVPGESANQSTTIEPEQPREVVVEPVPEYNDRSFYAGCEDEKKCVGDQKNCAAQRSCQVVVSYQPKPESGGVLIELLGKTVKYVALGLSTDQEMGDDSVIDCVRVGDEVRIHRSFNRRRDNVRLRNQSGISEMKGHFADDWLYCQFLLERSTNVQSSLTTTLGFDLDQDSFYLLLARGNSEKYGEMGRGIGYHDLGVSVTRVKHNLMSYGDTSLRRLFVRFHGFSIIIGWILILPISTFVMRYFKNTCNDRFIGNLSVWFAVHVILNGVVLGLTVAAIILILIPTKRHVIGSGGWTHHNIAAIIFTLLVFTQVILGIKIYGHRHFAHNRLSQFHAILGHLIFFASFYIIWESRHVRHGLPCATFPVLVAWIVTYFVIHIIISYQVCYVDFVNGAEFSRIYRLTGLAPSPVTPTELEPSGGIIRKVLLGILIVISAVATGFLIGMDAYGFPDCIKEAEYN